MTKTVLSSKFSKSYFLLLLDLAWTFFILGATTFGGGYAIIGVIERDLMKRKNWITQDELLDMITISQSTPGVIAINIATFIGYRTAGILGGIIVTLFITLPAWGVILLLSFCYTSLRGNDIVEKAMAGVKIAAIALVANASFVIFKSLTKTWKTMILVIFSIAAILIFHVDATWLIIAGLIFGVIFHKEQKT